MAQGAAVVIADNAAVNVTFSPEKITPELSTLVDRTTGVASRFRRLTVRFVPAKGNTKVNKSGLAISIPVWGTLPSGAQGVLYTLRARLEFDLPDGCTDVERKDLYAFTINGAANTLVRGALRDLDPFY